MTKRMNITAARKRFLSLPEDLGPGESLEIVRRGRPVLTILRVSEEGSNPLACLEEALKSLPEPKGKPPKDLAARYKKYLYGKKG